MVYAIGMGKSSRIERRVAEKAEAYDEIRSDEAIGLLIDARYNRDPLRRAEALRDLRPILDDLEREAFREARGAGLSWAKVAEPLGITRSGAQRRYAQLCRVVNPD